jgi:hypothetical protein
MELNYETLTSNEPVEISVTSTCLSVIYFDQWRAGPCISEDIYTPYAGDSGMLLQVYKKLTMAKLKLSCLSYNWVISVLPISMRV